MKAKTVNESLTSELFQIPEVLQQFYKIDGDFSNAGNWKAKILVGNSLSEGKKRGQWEEVGYCMISTKSNYIIPVARSDEHQTGYELLDELLRKYKLPDLNYHSVYLLGNTFVYEGRYKADEFQAIKKAYEYGATDLTIKKMGTDKSMSISEYIAADGDFDAAQKRGKKERRVSVAGQKFIDTLLAVIELFEQYRTNPMRQNPKFEERIITACEKLDEMVFRNEVLSNILRWGDNKKNKENYKAFVAAIEANDINKIEETLFSFGGIKNAIHIMLKANDKKIEPAFWSNEAALEQFNAMSGIKMK